MQSVIYIVTFLAIAAVAFVLQRSVRTTMEEPTRYRLFGWLQSGIGIVLIGAYYLGDARTPDTIALGWALTVFGGYLVESGRLRQRIGELEARTNSLGGSPIRQIPH